MSAALGVHPAEGALDSGKCAQWPIENEIKKQTCYPSSPSLPSPPSLSIHGWESNKPLPVCPGITVCDFSLTSQAALWHGGVIVSRGWKPFCHGRVEKDKAGPQSICLTGHCGIVSPASEEDRDWHMSGKVHARDKTPGFRLFTYSPGLRAVRMRVWRNGGRRTGGLGSASLTWKGLLPFKQWLHCLPAIRKTMPHRVNIKSSVHSSQTPSVGEDNGGTFTGEGRHRKDSGATWFKPEWLRKSSGRGVRCKGIQGGWWCWYPDTKVFVRAQIKSKKDKNGADNRDPLITAWGRREWAGCWDGLSGRSALLPSKNLSLSLCVCASQPTTQKRKKKILPPLNTKQSAPLT